MGPGDLEYGQAVSKEFLKHSQVHEAIREQWWEQQKDEVCRGINRKRNQANQAVKTRMRGKLSWFQWRYRLGSVQDCEPSGDSRYCSLLFFSSTAQKKRFEKNGKKLPSLEDILSMRANFDLTKWVFNNFMPCVISKNKFDANVHTNLWHNYVSDSDEAFLYAVIENVYDVVVTLPNEWEGWTPSECREWLVKYCEKHEDGVELFGEDAIAAARKAYAGGKTTTRQAGAEEGGGNSGGGRARANLDDDDQSGDKRDARPSIPGKYTKNYRLCQKYGGWKKAGLRRYNELFGMVQRDRIQHGKVFAVKYLDLHKNKKSKGKKNAKEVTDVGDEEDVRPMCSHDFGSVSAVGV